MRKSIILIIFIVLASLIAFVLISNSLVKTSNKDESIPISANIIALFGPRKINSSPPSNIRIPSIDIDTKIEQVGTTSDQSIGVPKDIANTAWFNLGPYPGEIGSSVIVGHYGWKNGISAVFDNLRKVIIGDRIYIANEKGIVTVFIVNEIRNYNFDDDATDIFVSNDGKAHLNLVTCEGIWDATKKSYSKRLVVFSVKE